MSAPTRNAFTINTTGSWGGFPFSAHFERHPGGVESLYFCALRIRDVSDVFAAHGRAWTAVFNVGHNEFAKDNRTVQVSLGECLADRGIEHRAVDDDLAMLPTEHVPRFLADFEHYNLCCSDFGPRPSDDALIAHYLAYHDKHWPFLPNAPESGLFIDTHDDCYFHMEARQREPLDQVFCRCLGIFAETMLDNHGRDVQDVSAPPMEQLLPLLEGGNAMTIPQDCVTLADGRLQMPTYSGKFSLAARSLERQTGLIEYDISTHVWGISRHQ